MIERAHDPECRPFEQFGWLRDYGLHGGGNRRVAVETAIWGRASVNFSHVHYDDQPDKRLRSATALSAIIHPADPRVPSLHTHVSWTEMRSGRGTWRLMADLNPANPDPADGKTFSEALARVAPEQVEHARAQGDKYFYIPSLERHRGQVHFYLEGFATDSPPSDFQLAKSFGECVIDTYAVIVGNKLESHRESGPPSDAERAAQLAYHSTYFLQVLTLDRGTTSGLLVHGDNDVGILGSLPLRVDRELLSSWVRLQPEPQGKLLEKLIAELPNENPTEVGASSRRALAMTIRDHYREHPEALKLQASGFTVPPTVANHL